MSNRIAVVVVALLVGTALYLGAVVVEDALVGGSDVRVTGEVVAGNATMHIDRVGRPTVVGEVENGLRSPVRDVTVTVTFSRDGATIGMVTVPPLVEPVPARERAPFVARLPNRSVRPTDFGVEVGFETGSDDPYAGLAVVESEVSDRSPSQVTVTGRVENRGGKRVDAHVVATFYDANGTVIGVRSVPTSPIALGPGDVGAFEVRFRTLGNVPSRASDVDRYELLVYAEPA